MLDRSLLPFVFLSSVHQTIILATRDTQFGQELALVMQTTHAQRMRSADSIPMCRLEFVFFHWKCTQVLQKNPWVWVAVAFQYGPEATKSTLFMRYCARYVELAYQR